MPFLLLFSTRVINFLSVLLVIYTSRHYLRVYLALIVPTIYPTFYSLSLSKFFPHCNRRSLLFSSHGRSSRPSISPRRSPAKFLMQDPDRKCEKVLARAALGTNKAACIPTHGGSHISAVVCTPHRETTHRRRLPLTDPRIHEWSVGYQWAARCYPHALDRALFSPSSPSPPLPSPRPPACTLALSRDRSRGYDVRCDG